MASMRFVGLDVHKELTAIAVAEEGRGGAQEYAVVPSDTPRVVRELRKLGPVGALRVCYEAGPCGFGLQRALQAAGIACVVVAPSLVPVRSGDRVKTDRRDARRLAHFLRSGDLTEVCVPDEQTEAIRDLERLREDAKNDERCKRHQLSKFLLRHERVYGRGDAGRKRPTAWTAAHLDWIRKQKFGYAAQEFALQDMVKAVEDATARVETLDRQIAVQVEGWVLAPLVRALQALRGVRLLTAATIAAEVFDLRRFERAAQFMAFLGLVPGERTTGFDPRRTSITHAGNAHVRRLLVESAHAYRLPPRVSRGLRERQQGLDPEVVRIAWKAQERLHRKMSRMLGRGVLVQKAVIAVARELAGFVWAIGRLDCVVPAAPGCKAA